MSEKKTVPGRGKKSGISAVHPPPSYKYDVLDGAYRGFLGPVLPRESDPSFYHYLRRTF